MSCGSRDSVPSRLSRLSLLSLTNDMGVRRISSLFEVPPKPFYSPKFKYSLPLETVLSSTATDRAEDGGVVRGEGTLANRWKDPPLLKRGVRGDLAAFIHTGPTQRVL